MLSSPYSKNASFATGQPLDSSQMSSSSSATQGSSAGSMAASKRGAAQRANSSPYRQPTSRTSRKQQRKSESDEGASTSSSKPRAGRGKKPPHELLSEAEKKANHIASEQKRRQNIRVGFDQLVEIVPALSQSHRSEALILQKSVDHIHKLVAAKNDLKERVRELQTVLGEMPPDDDSSEDEINYSY
ncbi:hypothetical protein INT43_006071 [Umbelopsis isabellina]|uniref:BHLH domain-containing protein n=1 Tax=Mortierella isabellina TaxID=91625 RepID=A0A8H7PK81_MORIS|nr:hypothetical protein INT43_006071 [Umbelopsis isabellina]